MRLICRVAGRRTTTFTLSEPFEPRWPAGRTNWHWLTAADGSERYLCALTATLHLAGETQSGEAKAAWSLGSSRDRRVSLRAGVGVKYERMTKVVWHWQALEIPEGDRWPEVFLVGGEASTKAAAERQAIEQANAGAPRVVLAEIRRRRLAKMEW